jgi:putative serine/threonine protein kinase
MENMNGINNKNSENDSKRIGGGKDGTVYKLSEEVCLKRFYKEKTQKQELMSLQMGKSSSVIPRIYGYGTNYIVMEYINGPSLKKHLKKEKRLSESMAEKILFLLDELKAVGFTRHDVEIRHILFNKCGDIKVIDLKRALTTERTVPTKLLRGLWESGFLNEFLKHVKNLHPAKYNEWKNILDEYGWDVI